MKLVRSICLLFACLCAALGASAARADSEDSIVFGRHCGSMGLLCLTERVFDGETAVVSIPWWNWNGTDGYVLAEFELGYADGVVSLTALADNGVADCWNTGPCPDAYDWTTNGTWVFTGEMPDGATMYKSYDPEVEWDHSIDLKGIAPAEVGEMWTWTVPDSWRVSVVPEPESYALMLAGLAVLAFFARRKRL